jgi:glycosyltransferase involved in cell wall biosynthesis
MTILYFGTYEENYSRNQIMIKSLRNLGHTVKECHISLWRDQIDKSNALRGPLRKLSFFLRVFSLYPRLLAKYLFSGYHDVIFVGYFGHLDVICAKLFTMLTYRNKNIVFDAFLSLYDTMVVDRKMVKEHSLFSRLIYGIDILSCRVADMIILDTNAHIEFFKNILKVPKNKMARVYASADSDVFVPKQTEKRDNKFHVLFVGKYIPLHGIEHIVEAAEILKGDNTIEFTFIGRGQMYPDIRRIVKEKELENIRFIEWVNYEKLPEHIAQADVCLGIFSDSGKASRVIPNKVFQSMAMGKPVITGGTPGAAEGLLDGENALLCRPADPHDLVKTIVRIKEDSALREHIAKHARETFEREFGEQAVRSSLAEILKKVVL